MLKRKEHATVLDVPIAIASSEEVADICLLFGELSNDNGQVVKLKSTPFESVFWDSVEISLVDFVERLEEFENCSDLLLVYELNKGDLCSAKDVVELFQRVFYRHGNTRYLRLLIIS